VAFFISNYAYAAKIYKCKNASGKVEFSNIQCKSTDSGGLVAIDAPMKPSYSDRRAYTSSGTGESDAARQLRLMQDASRREQLERDREASERRSRETHDAYMKAEKLQAEHSAESKKANCNYNKAKSKYWKERARKSGNSREQKHLYEPYQHMYKGEAGGC